MRKERDIATRTLAMCVADFGAKCGDALGGRFIQYIDIIEITI
jgi:hypothetical protein